MYRDYGKSDFYPKDGKKESFTHRVHDAHVPPGPYASYAWGSGSGVHTNMKL